MSLLYFLVSGFICAMIIFYISNVRYKNIFTNNYFIIILAGFILRMVFSTVFPGFQGDLDVLKYAADYLFKENQSEFYNSYDFGGIPPFYAFILYIIGLIRNVFGLQHEGFFFSTLVKLPSIIADLMTGILIYRLLYSRTSEKKALILSLSYVMNPAVVVISGVWGQLDSVFACLLIFSIYKLTKKDYLKASIFYTLAILSKPMAIIYLPLYLFAIYVYFKENKDKLRALGRFAGTILINAVIIFVMLYPFLTSLLSDKRKVFEEIFELGLNYASVNAYNFYTFVCGNWISSKEAFLFTTYENLSNMIFIAILVFAVLFLTHLKSEGKFFIAATFISVCNFMFTVRMHERYFFVSIALLLISYIYIREKMWLLLYSIFSMTFLINIIDIIYISLNENDMMLIQYSIIAFSAFNMILTVIFLVKIFKYSDSEEAVIIERNPKPIIEYDINNVKIEKSEQLLPFTKQDFIYIAALMIVYGVVAYVNLGNTYSPQSRFDHFDNNSYISFELEEPKLIKSVQYFLGPRPNKKIYIEVSEDGQVWNSSEEIELKDVFAWTEFQLNLTGKYVRILNMNDELMIMELALRDENSELLKIKAVDEGAEALFDEQGFVPLRKTYMNSTYFDEIYHPRTAYEFLEGLEVYEWTHPHLGKIIMTLGIALFGMTPFGWRFTGTAMGILMLPALYMLAKRVFRNSNWALFATSLFALDFMHFVQTRIGTIDSYITLFTIGMFYFMYRYYKTSFYDTPLWKTLLQLFMCGLCMALAVAAKWQGVYAAAGIALLFFITIGKRYFEYLYARQNGVEHIQKKFIKNLLITLGCCVIFFIVVPVVVYVLSYIPHFIIDEGNSFAEDVTNKYGEYSLIPFVIENQIRMFNYHAHLGDVHPYSSRWYLWMLNLRPILYYLEVLKVGYRGDIASFVNPAIAWGGLAAMFYSVSKYIKTRDKTILFLLIGYFASLVPWMMITTRTSFAYHYFPCVPFLVLFVTYFVRDFMYPKRKIYAYIYVAATFILFVMFYPVLSGIQVPEGYLDLLEWFPTW